MKYKGNKGGNVIGSLPPSLLPPHPLFPLPLPSHSVYSDSKFIHTPGKFLSLYI